jgi:hypothetical protein
MRYLCFEGHSTEPSAIFDSPFDAIHYQKEHSSCQVFRQYFYLGRTCLVRWL